MSYIFKQYLDKDTHLKSASDITVSGATVTVPVGYYESSVSKSISSGSVTVNPPTINSATGVVTAGATVSEGYVSGTPASKTLSLSTQAAKTVTPSSSSQTAVAAGKYTTGAVTVAAVPTETKTMSLGSSAPSAVTPTSGKFLSSVSPQIDSTVIKAENIAEGVTLLGILGTHQGGGGGTVSKGTTTKTTTADSSTLTFTGLSGEPTFFCIYPTADVTMSSSYKVTSILYINGALTGKALSNSSSDCLRDQDTGLTKTYSNGTLTITNSTYNFGASTYKIIYTYGGSPTVTTDSGRASSGGATKITFSNVTSLPDIMVLDTRQRTAGAASSDKRFHYLCVDSSVSTSTSEGNRRGTSSEALTTYAYDVTYNGTTLTFGKDNDAAGGGYFSNDSTSYFDLYKISLNSTSTTVTPLSVTENGTYTAPSGTAYSPVTVNVSTTGSTIYTDWCNKSTNSTSMTLISNTITVTTAGTYKINACIVRSNTSNTASPSAQLYKNGTAVSSATCTSWNGTNNNNCAYFTTTQTLSAGDALTIRGKSSRSSYYTTLLGWSVEKQ